MTAGVVGVGVGAGVVGVVAGVVGVVAGVVGVVVVGFGDDGAGDDGLGDVLVVLDDGVGDFDLLLLALVEVADGELVAGPLVLGREVGPEVAGVVGMPGAMLLPLDWLKIVKINTIRPTMATIAIVAQSARGRLRCSSSPSSPGPPYLLWNSYSAGRKVPVGG